MRKHHMRQNTSCHPLRRILTARPCYLCILAALDEWPMVDPTLGPQYRYRLESSRPSSRWAVNSPQHEAPPRSQASILERACAAPRAASPCGRPPRSAGLRLQGSPAAVARTLLQPISNKCSLEGARMRALYAHETPHPVLGSDTRPACLLVISPGLDATAPIRALHASFITVRDCIGSHTFSVAIRSARGIDCVMRITTASPIMVMQFRMPRYCDQPESVDKLRLDDRAFSTMA